MVRENIPSWQACQEKKWWLNDKNQRYRKGFYGGFWCFLVFVKMQHARLGFFLGYLEGLFLEKKIFYKELQQTYSFLYRCPLYRHFICC